MKPPATQPSKKPYSAPKLFTYGGLSEMTKTRGKVGSLDGGKGSMSRTGL